MNQAREDIVFEEPTVAEEPRETSARENMTRAVAELVSTALPVSAVLVVARGPGLPSGTLLGEHDRKQDAELDPVILAELLTNAHDDRVVSALIRLLLGDLAIDHTVARDRNGTIVGVIALRTNKRISDAWLRMVLARAANMLAGWVATELACAWPPQALIEAIKEPALAHDGGMVIVANTALARLLGREPNEVIGTPVARITQRLPLLWTCSLVVAGKPRTALIFSHRARRVETNLRDSVDIVLGDRYAFVRQTSRVSFDRREDVCVAVPQDAVEEIISLALLEMTAAFAKAIAANTIRISVYRDEASVVLELVATGALAHCPDAEHLGSIICASRVRSVGGYFLLDVSRPETRVIRISLPVEP
jgi:PAS domain-containing protein